MIRDEDVVARLRGAATLLLGAAADIESLKCDRQSLSDRIDGLREALREVVDAQDETNAEAERAKQPGANAWSSAPMVRLIHAHANARTALHQEGIAPATVVVM